MRSVATEGGRAWPTALDLPYQLATPHNTSDAAFAPFGRSREHGSRDDEGSSTIVVRAASASAWTLGDSPENLELRSPGFYQGRLRGVNKCDGLLAGLS